MRSVLFFGLVGAALYTALVVSHDLLSDDKGEDNLTRQALSSPPARQLRSWGTDLPALASRAPAALGGPDATAGQYDGNRDQGSGKLAGSEEIPTSTATAYDPTEWVRVRLAARVHREASVSSPTMRFYQPGSTLQVVSRENGWAQINDPSSGEGGWVLEQYLVSSDGPAVTQTAAATPTALSEPTQAKPTPRAKKRARASRPTSDGPTVTQTAAATPTALSEPTQAKPAPRAKKRARASRPTVRAPHDVAVAQFDTRSEPRAERRRGFGLFFFRRYARSQPAAPYANRAWLMGSE
jgi:hypothetical protein